MSEHANIDVILEERARRVHQENRRMLACRLLSALDAKDDDYVLDYASVLRRLQTVLAKELAELAPPPQQAEEETKSEPC
jgi:hypothetical protein